MYIGRDMTELSMLPKSKWDKNELSLFSPLPSTNGTLFKPRRTEHSPRNC